MWNMNKKKSISKKCSLSVSVKLNHRDKASPLILLEQNGCHMAGVYRLNRNSI